MLNSEITPQQKENIQKYWSAIAGEPLEIKCDYLQEPIFAFGSELGVLRLYAKMKAGRVQFSKELQTWYYCNK